MRRQQPAFVSLAQVSVPPPDFVELVPTFSNVYSIRFCHRFLGNIFI